MWVSVVLDPTKTLRRHPLSTQVEKKRKNDFTLQDNKRKCQNDHSTNDNSQSFLKSCLKNWSKSEVCPLEDPDIHWSATELRENDTQSNMYPGTNQFSSSNEDTDDESTLYSTNSFDNAQALSSMVNSSMLDTLEGDQLSTSNLQKDSDNKKQQEEKTIVNDVKEENKSRKRKRLTKRASCKRFRKDYCRRFQRPRTIFHKAIDALKVSWSDPQLLKILREGEIPGKHCLIVYDFVTFYNFILDYSWRLTKFYSSLT